MLDNHPRTKGILNSIGLVFGDIGTSPIYTLTVIFLLIKPTEANVMGVLSLIVWTLMLLVTVEYAWLATSLGKKGEGGTIVLKELLTPLLKPRQAAFVALLSLIGVSFLIGDGVITPAISMLSAVEGLTLVPGLGQIPQETLVLIAGGLAVALFAFQKRGTERVAWTFGPLMFLWFLSLAVSGIAAILYAPGVVNAVNPYYALRFLLENGIAGFFVLSAVILCATGGEALYADIGQLGRKPIVRAWYLVFAALLLNYLGQGAFLLQNPGARNILFEMILWQARVLYVPFLLLSVAATVIASQAMISGMFSIVYQGITTRIMPLLKVDHTSSRLRSQIYIGAVNWMLLFSVLFIMFEFRESHRLAAAYGLAVTVTMAITGVLMTWIFYRRGKALKATVSLLVTLVDMVFLVSNVYKIPYGGYWSLVIAGVALAVLLIYTSGQKMLYKALKPMDFGTFVKKYGDVYRRVNKISGTALFFARDTQHIPSYIAHTMFENSIIYEDNVIVSIFIRDVPSGVSSSFKARLADGLRVFEIRMGYMEVVDVIKLVREAGIRERTIFYGIEDIVTCNPVWQVFAVIKKLSPSFVQFYKLPQNEIHGVITRVEM